MLCRVVGGILCWEGYENFLFLSCHHSNNQWHFLHVVLYRVFNFLIPIHCRQQEIIRALWMPNTMGKSRPEKYSLPERRITWLFDRASCWTERRRRDQQDWNWIRAIPLVGAFPGTNWLELWSGQSRAGLWQRTDQKDRESRWRPIGNRRPKNWKNNLQSRVETNWQLTPPNSSLRHPRMHCTENSSRLPNRTEERHRNDNSRRIRTYKFWNTTNQPTNQPRIYLLITLVYILQLIFYV